MTDMFLEVAKSIQDTSASSTRYGKIFALRDILSEIETLKDIDTATKLKIKNGLAMFSICTRKRIFTWL